MGEDKLYAMRHSLAHIMATAVQQLWPDAKFGVGPVVEHGFYYDIDLGETKISEQQFNKIEKIMRRIIAEKQDLFAQNVQLMMLFNGPRIIISHTKKSFLTT